MKRILVLMMALCMLYTAALAANQELDADGEMGSTMVYYSVGANTDFLLTVPPEATKMSLSDAGEFTCDMTLSLAPTKYNVLNGKLIVYVDSNAGYKLATPSGTFIPYTLTYDNNTTLDTSNPKVIDWTYTGDNSTVTKNLHLSAQTTGVLMEGYYSDTITFTVSTTERTN